MDLKPSLLCCYCIVDGDDDDDDDSHDGDDYSASDDMGATLLLPQLAVCPTPVCDSVMFVVVMLLVPMLTHFRVTVPLFDDISPPVHCNTLLLPLLPLLLPLLLVRCAMLKYSSYFQRFKTYIFLFATNTK